MTMTEPTRDAVASDVTPVATGIPIGSILAGQPHSPVVYFLRVGDQVKIGTSTSLKRRVESLSRSLDDVVLVFPGGLDVEMSLHQRYQAHRVRPQREWFYIRGSLEALLTAAGEPPALPLAGGPPPLSPGRVADGVTLKEASRDEGSFIIDVSHVALRKYAEGKRDAAFPPPIDPKAFPRRWSASALCDWYDNRPRRRWGNGGTP